MENIYILKIVSMMVYQYDSKTDMFTEMEVSDMG